MNDISVFQDSLELPKSTNEKLYNETSEIMGFKNFEEFESKCKNNWELYSEFYKLYDKLKLRERIKILNENNIKIIELEDKIYSIEFK